MNPKRSVPRHIIIKMAKFKDKERTLKAATEKQLVTYKGAPIRESVITQQEPREWQEIFLVMKSKVLQSIPPYPAKFYVK